MNDHQQSYVETISAASYLDHTIDRAVELLEQARVLVNGHMADVAVRSMSVHTGGERSMPKVTINCATYSGQRFTVTLS